jgi:hypothetical protein
MGNSLFIVKAKEHQVKDGDSIKSIADANGLTEQELAQFNWGTDDPDSINKFLRNRVGCTKRTKDGKNYVFTSKDKPGILYIPEEFPKKSYAVNQSQTLQLKRPKIFCTIFIQTTDVFGYAMGNITLSLVPVNGGSEISVTTDAHGSAKKEEVLFGSYRVKYKGKDAYFLTYGNLLTRAIINTDNANNSITSIAVWTNSEETSDSVEYRSLLNQTYTSPVSKEEDAPDEPLDDGKQLYCTDNFAIAAGWKGKNEIDIDKLLTILSEYIEDQVPLVRLHGFFTLILDADNGMLTVYDENRNKEKSFNIVLRANAAVGAYAIFETVNRTVFYDFSNRHYGISNLDDSDPDHYFSYDDLVSESDRTDLNNLINSHKPAVPVFYYLVSGDNMKTIARHGGSGFLENYGEDKSLHNRIHKRNKAVCETVREVYKEYVDWYINRLTSTDDPHKTIVTEEQIQDLGQPESLFMFPMPAGASRDQIIELHDANYTTQEIRIWIAISNRLDSIYKVLSDGQFFFTLKLDMDKLKETKQSYGSKEIEVSGIGGFEATSNFHWDDQGVFVGDLELEIKAAMESETEVHGKGINLPDGTTKKGSATKIGLAQELAINVETGEKTVKYRAKLGVGEIEMASSGDIKCEIKITDGGGVVGEANWHKAQFGFGGYLTLGDPEEPKGKLYFLLNFQGLREDTLLRYFSNAPGFFQRRTIEELVGGNLVWSALRTGERSMLEVLEWKQPTWDGTDQDTPENSKESFDKLNFEQKKAAFYFGILPDAWEETWRDKKKNLARKIKYKNSKS